MSTGMSRRRRQRRHSSLTTRAQVPPPSGDSSGSVQEKLQEFQKRRDERLESEAKQAKEVAKAHAAVARAGLVVAGLQRQAAEPGDGCERDDVGLTRG